MRETRAPLSPAAANKAYPRISNRYLAPTRGLQVVFNVNLIDAKSVATAGMIARIRRAWLSRGDRRGWRERFGM